jgi:hypothetical protein
MPAVLPQGEFLDSRRHQTVARHSNTVSVPTDILGEVKRRSSRGRAYARRKLNERA